MTLDANAVSKEIGQAWAKSPLMFVVAFGFILILSVYAYNNYVGTSWLVNTVNANLDEAEGDREDVKERLSVLTNEIHAVSEELDQERERAKIFRDEIRVNIQQNRLDQERREAEFWAGINAQFDTINTQNSQNLGQFQEVLDRLDDHGLKHRETKRDDLQLR